MGGGSAAASTARGPPPGGDRGRVLEDEERRPKRHDDDRGGGQGQRAGGVPGGLRPPDAAAHRLPHRVLLGPGEGLVEGRSGQVGKNLSLGMDILRIEFLQFLAEDAPGVEQVVAHRGLPALEHLGDLGVVSSSTSCNTKTALLFGGKELGQLPEDALHLPLLQMVQGDGGGLLHLGHQVEEALVGAMGALLVRMWSMERL